MGEKVFLFERGTGWQARRRCTARNRARHRLVPFGVVGRATRPAAVNCLTCFSIPPEAFSMSSTYMFLSTVTKVYK